MGDRVGSVRSMTDLVDAPVWNPFDPEFLLDPYPVYARLREEDPVHRTPIGTLIVSRYDDVHRVLRDTESSVQRFETNVDLPEHMLRLRQRSLERAPSILGLDPPDHTRLRGLVQRTFTPRAVGRMREQTTAIVDDLLDDLAGRDEIDLISDYAFVIPFAVIHSMLGLPDTDMAMVRSWSHALTQTLEPYLSPEQVDAAMDGGEHMDAYLRDAVAQKRRNPADDLLTQLVEVEEAGDDGEGGSGSGGESESGSESGSMPECLSHCDFLHGCPTDCDLSGCPDDTRAGYQAYLDSGCPSLGVSHSVTWGVGGGNDMGEWNGDKVWKIGNYDDLAIKAGDTVKFDWQESGGAHNLWLFPARQDSAEDFSRMNARRCAQPRTECSFLRICFALP